MIVIYTSPGCASCRKVKQWLKERDLKFIEKNIFSVILDEKEIKHLFLRSENGTDDLISKRSKIILENKIDVEDMKMNDLIQFVRQNPSVLRRPIIIDEKNLLVGYDEEEIDVFVPSQLRKIAEDACNPVCPNYFGCGSLREEIR